MSNRLEHDRNSVPARRSSPARRRRIFYCVALGLPVLLSAQSMVADTLTTTSGEVLSGRIFRYDEYSMIVVLDEGDRVVVPQKQIERIERSKRRNPRFSKRARLILSVDLILQDESPERVLVASLKDPLEDAPKHDLKTEAQTLLYLMQSQEHYADAYRTRYRHEGRRYELEYECAKDSLVRRNVLSGRGVQHRVLGGSGEGKQALELAVRGKIQDRESLLSRIQKPSHDPVRSKKTMKREKTESRRQPIWNP